MSRYLPEPPHTHGGARHTAILLINLGTPAAPTASALRRYLRQFLWDPRVVEIPRPIWWLILNGIILTVRPAKSAAKYAKIWMDGGSPLKVHTERQAAALRQTLDRHGQQDVLLDWAMRYGEPSVATALDRLKRQGAQRILILPLYPQYAASTSASAMDAVAFWLLQQRNPPELRFVKQFADDDGYIAALAASVRAHWAEKPRTTQALLIVSFHGLPRRSLDLGDPYYCQCQKTARLLAEALALSPADYRVTFQSRFGKAEWLQPYTQATLEDLARQGVQRVDVLCPGFVADCLETLEEIAMECRAAFLDHGGKEFNYIPCLNRNPDWISALHNITTRHLSGWPLKAQSDRIAQQRATALAASVPSAHKSVGID